MLRFLRYPSFWIPFVLSFAIVALFFAWELGYLRAYVPSLVRAPVTPWDIAFAILIVTLLPLNVGLSSWHSKHESCPVGVKRATGLAGTLSIITLLCPVCIALPVTLIGISTVVAILSPLLPLLRLVTLILLVAATWMLWPKGRGVTR